MAARPLEFQNSHTRKLPPSTRPAFAGCLLSAAEIETIRLLARGLSYAQAARERRCRVSTIRSLVHTAFGRLGVSSIAQALAVCSHVGWLDVVPRDGQVVELADRRVTWAQRLYLEAFDQSLRAGDDEAEVKRTSALRDAALTGVFSEADQERPWRPMTTDPLERIAQTLRTLDAQD